MGDTSGCQISSNNLAVYLQGVTVTPSANISTEYFVTASLPSSASTKRVWQFTTQGLITGPDTATLTLDYTQAHENCPTYNITFDGALNGSLIIHNQVFSAKKFVSYELISTYVLQLTLRVPKTILECFGTTSQQPYFFNVNINDATGTTTNEFVFKRDGSLASYPVNTTNTFTAGTSPSLAITFDSTYSYSTASFSYASLASNVTISMTNNTSATLTINDYGSGNQLSTVAPGSGSGSVTTIMTYSTENANWSVTQYQDMTGSVYYRIVPTEYINVPGYEILNLVVGYRDFSYQGTLQSFTSYLDYTTTDGTTSTTTVYPTSITFLTGYNVNDSTGSSVPLPINASTTDTSGIQIQPSNVFILPLVQIPSGASFNAGYVVNTTYNNNSYSSIYTLPSSSMSFLSLHIYDNTTSGSYQGYALPDVSGVTVNYNSTSSPFSLVTTEDALDLTVSQLLTLYSISDYVFALYDTTSCTGSETYTPYTMDSTTFLNQTPSLFYSSSSEYPLIYLQAGSCSSNTINPGYYFSNTAGSDTSGSLQTSGQYLITSVKNNNYSVPGLLEGTTPASYSLSYSNTTDTFTVSTNVIPVSPFGNFPTYANTASETFSQSNILVNCPAVYINPEYGSGVEPYDFSNIQFPNTVPPPPGPTPSGPPYPVTEDAIAYSLANNFVLTALDASFQNSEPKESTDYNEHHINQSYNYHNHKTPSILTDFVASTTTFYVTAWAMDGNPILGPVIINVTEYYQNATTIPPYVLQINNKYYQYMTSQFLDVYHGLSGTYTITIQDTSSSTGITSSTTKTFTYAYFSTPDYPFTMGAYFGNPTTVPPISTTSS